MAGGRRNRRPWACGSRAEEGWAPQRRSGGPGCVGVRNLVAVAGERRFPAVIGTASWGREMAEKEGGREMAEQRERELGYYLGVLGLICVAFSFIMSV